MNNIFIPKKINVGFQKRSGTYTGQLAYVIYYDEKGKLRKETSWNSWRDEDIKPEEFDNEPTEGFVLNKKVGGYSTGWNHRQTYTRIYDPRNFEFEITVDNLLYILENTNCIKGKGLEGQFVYGWDGKDLILIPTSSPDYEELTKYNELLHENKSIKVKDLVIGGTYLTKQKEEWIYMGKFNYWNYVYDEIPNERDRWGCLRYKSVRRYINKGKRHFFVRETLSYDKKPYLDTLELSSISNKFIDIISSECVDNYAYLFDKLECKTSYSPYDKTKDEYINYTFEEYKSYVDSLNLDDVSYNYHRSFYVSYILGDEYTKQEIKFNKEKKEFYISGEWDRVLREYPYITIGSIEDVFEKYKPVYKNEYLQNGKLYNSDKRSC